MSCSRTQGSDAGETRTVPYDISHSLTSTEVDQGFVSLPPIHLELISKKQFESSKLWVIRLKHNQ